MPGTAPKAEILRALARIVRGLSSLFWGLPLALLVFGLPWIDISSPGLRTHSLTEWLRSMHVLPPLSVTVFLYYGVAQLAEFQPQERIWQSAIDRTKLLAIVSAGLSPFIYWWHQAPQFVFFAISVAVLLISQLLFLASLNELLNRLAAMLPDETLRIETRFFSHLNLYLLVLILAMLFCYGILLHLGPIPPALAYFFEFLIRFHAGPAVFFLILPLAMTMTLIWKIKSFILSSLFDSIE